MVIKNCPVLTSTNISERDKIFVDFLIFWKSSKFQTPLRPRSTNILFCVFFTRKPKSYELPHLLGWFYETSDQQVKVVTSEDKVLASRLQRMRRDNTQQRSECLLRIFFTPPLSMKNANKLDIYFCLTSSWMPLCAQSLQQANDCHFALPCTW